METALSPNRRTDRRHQRQPCGVVRANQLNPVFDRVLGGIHGIEGVLEGKLYDLSDLTAQEIDLLKQTPSSALGTCRYKLKRGNDTDFKRLIDVMDAHDIETMFYIGGNDSMDTVDALAEWAQANGCGKRFVGIPKRSTTTSCRSTTVPASPPQRSSPARSRTQRAWTTTPTRAPRSSCSKPWAATQAGCGKLLRERRRRPSRLARSGLRPRGVPCRSPQEDGRNRRVLHRRVEGAHYADGTYLSRRRCRQRRIRPRSASAARRSRSSR